MKYFSLFLICAFASVNSQGFNGIGNGQNNKNCERCGQGNGQNNGQQQNPRIQSSRILASSGSNGNPSAAQENNVQLDCDRFMVELGGVVSERLLNDIDIMRLCEEESAARDAATKQAAREAAAREAAAQEEAAREAAVREAEAREAAAREVAAREAAVREAAAREAAAREAAAREAAAREAAAREAAAREAAAREAAAREAAAREAAAIEAEQTTKTTRPPTTTTTPPTPTRARNILPNGRSPNFAPAGHVPNTRPQSATTTTATTTTIQQQAAQAPAKTAKATKSVTQALIPNNCGAYVLANADCRVFNGQYCAAGTRYDISQCVCVHELNVDPTTCTPSLY